MDVDKSQSVKMYSTAYKELCKALALPSNDDSNPAQQVKDLEFNKEGTDNKSYDCCNECML